MSAWSTYLSHCPACELESVYYRTNEPCKCLKSTPSPNLKHTAWFVIGLVHAQLRKRVAFDPLANSTAAVTLLTGVEKL